MPLVLDSVYRYSLPSLWETAMTKPTTKPKRKRVWKAWIGLVDGRPCYDKSLDTYDLINGAVVADLFKFKKDALKRFEEVIRVEVRELEAK